MSAPDKLYVSQLIYETWQYQIPDPDDETQVEYIRKDFLLEWAKHTINDGASCDDYELGYQHALLELIDKLNSM